MSDDPAFFSLKKLSKAGIIRKAARHNRRVIQAELGSSEKIDPTRSHLNETLVGPATADEVPAKADALLREAGITKLRTNQVLALELVFSLPEEYVLDERAYFSDCVAWAASRYGGEKNILSADIHRDEPKAHCHVLMLPLIGGKMRGSDLVGHRPILTASRDEFFSSVAARYGLKKPPGRLYGTTKSAGAESVLAWLKERADAALKSRLWPQLRKAIQNDPVAYMVALGIDAQRPPKRMRSMTQIFTSPGKGKKREEFPIGFRARTETPSLCSVGFVPPPTSPTATAQPVETEQHTPPQTIEVIAPPILETVRVRDCDLDPGTYDPETGEFFSTAKPITHTRERHVSQAISDSAGSEAHG